MTFEIKVTRRVIDGDEFGPCEYVLEVAHPNGTSAITSQAKCPGKAFRALLCDLAVETIQREGL
jgi:hypothetical protein